MALSTKVREIKAAIWQQAMNGRKQVTVPQGRVIDVKTVKGQLKARVMNGTWIDVESVNIDS